MPEDNLINMLLVLMWMILASSFLLVLHFWPNLHIVEETRLVFCGHLPFETLTSFHHLCNALKAFKYFSSF